jgi:hypothetical protein
MGNNTETSITPKTFKVSITFESITANNPLEASKIVAKWLLEEADNFIYDVVDENNIKRSYSVDLSDSTYFECVD